MIYTVTITLCCHLGYKKSNGIFTQQRLLEHQKPS